MKKGITLVLGLLMAFQVAWSNAYEHVRCRTHFKNVDNSLSLVDKVKQDLVAGVWAKEKESTFPQVRLQFNLDGRLDYHITEQNGQERYEQVKWQLFIEDYTPYLALGSNRDICIYKIIPTCEGIDLLNTSNGTKVNLTLTPAVASDKIGRIRSAMVGQWVNTMYPFEVAKGQVEGAYLRYEFRKDGTFTKRIGSKELEIVEHGQWDISRDGKSVIFAIDGSHEAKTKAASIKYLQLDELVLRHTIDCRDQRFSTGSKDFYFNKQ